MSIPKTVSDYLSLNEVPFEVMHHNRSTSSLQSALSAQITPKQLAKAVLLRSNGRHLLAVLPADRDIDLKLLRDEFDPSLELAPEHELPSVFADCSPGAVPAIGSAYGLQTIVDEHLREQREVFFEAGDHEDLVHISEPDFERLLGGEPRFLSFSH